MKRLNLRCLVIIFCVLLFVAISKLVLAQPMYNLDPKDTEKIEMRYFSHSNINELTERYEKYNDEYVKEYFLQNLIDEENNPQKKVEYIKKLKGFNKYGNISFISTLLYYGHFEDAKELARKSNENYNDCQGILTTRGEYLSCKLRHLNEFFKSDDNSQFYLNYIAELENGKLFRYDESEFTQRMKNKIDDTWYDSHKAFYYLSKRDLDTSKYYMDKTLKDSFHYAYNSSYFLIIGEKYMLIEDYKKAVECFETHIALTNKIIDKNDYIYLSYGMRNLSRIYKNDIIPYGSYNLHKKIAECYKKLGDEKNAQVHEKIMETMLSW